TLRTGVGRIIRYPSVAARHDDNHDFRFGDLLQASRECWYVPAGWEILHHARRESSCGGGLGGLFAVFLQVVRGGGDEDNGIMGHSRANSSRKVEALGKNQSGLQPEEPLLSGTAFGDQSCRRPRLLIPDWAFVT